ncbi:DUF4349 domain-containing protein [Chryseolinea lacunae]|uniref:DUF4349 domain-containing protein n=1 Tax=Chryseolinea lacunae TaxID=2801331 RepID=A0ABS1KU37_9BACT|nr:DUF4349 domain-containing protein [Chryseolinea lacunae]MBL0742772.1 DUF4349 domain-containing protein [Chryseolinea lacunae]
MRTKYLIVLLAGLLSCHARSREVEGKFAAPPAITHAVMMNAPPPLVPRLNLVREAKLVLQVKNVNATTDSLRSLLSQFQAYASDEHQEKTNVGLRMAMTIRVGENAFEHLLKRIESLGQKVSDRSITLKDVTMQFTDLNVRLKSKKEVESRYHQILQQAKTVKDMLAIEEQLGTTREEIESMEAELKYMSHQLAYCTIDLSFTQHHEEPPTGFARELGLALQNGWRAFLGMMLQAVRLWPWIVMTVGVVFWLLHLRKTRKLRTSVV